MGEPLLPGRGPPGEERPGGGVFGAGGHQGREPAQEIGGPGVRGPVLSQEPNAPGARADTERLLGEAVAGGQYDGVGGQAQGVAGRAQARRGPLRPGEERVGTGRRCELNRPVPVVRTGSGARGRAPARGQHPRPGAQGQYGHLRGQGVPQERGPAGRLPDPDSAPFPDTFSAPAPFPDPWPPSTIRPSTPSRSADGSSPSLSRSVRVSTPAAASTRLTVGGVSPGACCTTTTVIRLSLRSSRPGWFGWASTQECGNQGRICQTVPGCGIGEEAGRVPPGDELRAPARRTPRSACRGLLPVVPETVRAARPPGAGTCQ